jgi:hypothetical protein
MRSAEDEEGDAGSAGEEGAAGKDEGIGLGVADTVRSFPPFPSSSLFFFPPLFSSSLPSMPMRCGPYAFFVIRPSP